MNNSHQKTVLVVDDQTSVLDLVGASLESVGYQVIKSPTGKDALRKAGEYKLDLILLDVNLPDMNGFVACGKLKEREETYHIPVVMCTARGMKEDVMAASRVGAQGYIVKPFKKSTLVQKVAAVIGLPPGVGDVPEEE